jgi:CheY-like chemotaxis protein
LIRQTAFFDVVIMDLNMPLMDGFQACKNIKEMYQDLMGDTANSQASSLLDDYD